MKYQLLDLEAFSVVGLRVPSGEVSALWKRCRAEGTLSRLAGETPWPLELFWGDSFEAGGVSMLGVVRQDARPGTELCRCPRSRWLHTLAEGPQSTLEDVWRELNGGFLPRNGFRTSELPRVEVYRVWEPEYCLVDILLPLA